MSVHARARIALADLIQTTGWLAVSLMPGTARPWKVPTITDERRNEMDALAKAERHERTDIAPGDSPDPYNFGIADLLVEILMASDLMAEQVAQDAGWDRLPHASSAYADPVPFLRYVEVILSAGVENHTAAHITEVCAPLVKAGAQLCGVFADGQLLTGLCPWCGGKTSRTPVGGSPTLRVHTDAFGPLIVCEGGMCEPPSKDVGTWRRGMPAWTIGEWDWLAQRIEHADACNVSEPVRISTQARHALTERDATP